MNNLTVALSSVFLWIFAPLALQASGVGADRRDTLHWEMEALHRVPSYSWVKTDSAVTSLLYESVAHKGKQTRVFAYYSNPDKLAGRAPSGKKFPGIVLIHGGGGKAFSEWVAMWAKRGYAAIAMDLAGKDGSGTPLPDGGPDQSIEEKITGFSSENPKDTWPYYAVASVTLAHSLLRSFDEVAPIQTVVTGISWGGYLTCMVAGLDHRYQAAVPVYGCGYSDQSDILKNMLGRLSENEQQAWLRYFDPSRYIGQARMPILFLNGNKDKHYNVVPYHSTYSLVPSEQRFICIKPAMKHSHPAGWESREIELFFREQLTGQPQLPHVLDAAVRDHRVEVSYSSPVDLKTAKLYYSNDDTSLNENRIWHSADAQIDLRKKQVSVAVPPAGFRYGFVQLVAVDGSTASTAYFITEPSRPAYYPPFRWDNVPMMAHFGKHDDELTEAEIHFLTKHFSWTVLEKGHALKKYGSTEAGIIGDAQRIKAVDPAYKVLYYWNSSINFSGMYDAVDVFEKHPEWVLKAKDGSPVLAHKNTRKRYDHSQPELRRWWVTACANVVNHPAIDGVFIDALPQIAMHRQTNVGLLGREKQEANEEGLIKSLMALREQTPGKLLLYNGLRGRTDLWADMGTRYLAYTDAAMVEHFTSITATDKEVIAQNIQAIQEVSRTGKIVVVKGFPEFSWLDQEMMEKPYAELEKLAGEQLLFPLATFLIAAGENCYFCYSWGYRENHGTFSWYPAFDKPLGPPKGDAIKQGWVYTREFEHCKVTVNIADKTAEIVYD